MSKNQKSLENETKFHERVSYNENLIPKKEFVECADNNLSNIKTEFETQDNINSLHSYKLNEWLSKSDVCRFCISSSGTLDLSSLYISSSGESEVLSVVLEECYGIIMSNILEWGPSRLVCEKCAKKLQLAYNFKRQILQAERAFTKYLSEKDVLVDVKIEEDSLDVDILNAVLVDVKIEEDSLDVNILNTEEAELEPVEENEISNAKKRKKATNKAKDDKKPLKLQRKMLKISTDRAEDSTDEEIVVNNVSNKEPIYNDEIVKQTLEKMRINITCENVLKYTSACPFRRDRCKFKCFYCKKLFKTINLLRAHTKIHTVDDMSKTRQYLNCLSIDITNLKCVSCNIDLKDMDHMVQHLHKAHEKIIYKECIVLNEYKNDEIEITTEAIRDEIEIGTIDCDEDVEDGKSLSVTEETKQISLRKRIRVTLNTILKDTTACPFRHRKSWFQCFFCTESFIEMDALKLHTKQNHTLDDISKLKRYPSTLQIDISDFKCQICCTDLSDIDHMAQHFSEVHNEVVYRECIADFKINKSPYVCHMCNEQFHVFRSLTVHLNQHYTNYICEECGKSFLNDKRLKVHKRTHEKGAFPCTKCGKVLKTLTSKANHMEAHSKRVLKCNICFKSMKHYNDRIKHMSEVHNITHKFKCALCSKEYKIRHYLATHMRQTHGNKNKKCLECGMAFITNHGLKKHVLKHTGVKAFSCSLCSKSFGRSYTLREHMRGHEGKFNAQ